MEFKHEAVFKNYIEFLHSKKKQYSLENKKSMGLCIKIMINSFYGGMLTDKTRFKDIKICTTKSQALKLTKKPNFNSFNVINENLLIIEMNKNKYIFDSPILLDLKFFSTQNVICMIICIILFLNYLEEKI